MSKQFNCQKTLLFQAIQFSKTDLNQTIQFSISIDFVYTQINVKTIQLSKSIRFSSFSSIDRALSGANTPGKSGPGSNGNEGVLRIPQSSSITGTSPFRLFSIISRTLIVGGGGRAYPAAEVPSVYSTAPADWARVFKSL